MLLSSEQLIRARNRLEQRGVVSTQLIGQSLAASWQRSVEANVDLGRAPNPAKLSERELADRRDCHEIGRHLALWEMRTIFNQIAGSGFLVAFGNAEGLILDTIVDRGFDTSDYAKVIVPGSIWAECVRGTNALGTCAVVRRPVAVQGMEHFVGAYSEFTCFAAPFFHSDGRLAGVLDASASYRSQQHHTLALMGVAASHVENSLFLYEQNRHAVFLFHPRREFLNSINGGLISFTREGLLHSVTRRGRDLLSGLDLESGLGFEEVFDGSFEQTLARLRREEHVSLRDRLGRAFAMRWRNDRKRFHGTVGAPSPAPRKSLQEIKARRRAGREYVTQDPHIVETLKTVRRGLHQALPVLIHGETGTGKEFVARTIHDMSGRNGSFVAVNCGAVPEGLFEAEIFGYAPGAFTGARQQGSKGLARAADGGTLFLDEIGDLAPASQVALLRFLDDFEVRGIGSLTTAKVDVQIIAATATDLAKAVAANRFRSDLYYRLNVLEVALAPLREREDFPQIVRHLLADIADRDVTLSARAMEELARLPWPGNLRELRSMLTRLVLQSDTALIDQRLVLSLISPPKTVCPNCVGHPVKEQMCRKIYQAMRAHNGNISRVARELGISRTTIYRHQVNAGAVQD